MTTETVNMVVADAEIRRSYLAQQDAVLARYPNTSFLVMDIAARYCARTAIGDVRDLPWNQFADGLREWLKEHTLSSINQFGVIAFDDPTEAFAFKLRWL
jgi:hypothetical protein